MKTLFFDLDGTLTDPKAGVTGSIQFALEQLGRPVPEADALTWCIGPPLLASFHSLLGDEGLAAEALVHYRARFGTVGLYENSPYPGIEEALRALAAAGHRLFIATSKPTVYALQIVAHFALDGFFEQVFGSELDGTRSDKTDLLAHALEETAADPRASVMIGDRGHDMIGARNNAMARIGVLYGYGSNRELVEAGAQRLAATAPELPGCVSWLGD